MQKRVYSKAVRVASKGVLEKARSKAPGRTIAKALTVRSNSKPARMLFGMKLTVRGGVFSSDRTARRRGSGTTYRPDEAVRYYRFQELGTKYHPAKAFLEPALEASSKKFLTTLKRELEAGLEREAL